MGDVTEIAVYEEGVFPSGALVKRYEFTESEGPIKPTIALFDDGTFQFIFSGLSSYIGIGTYAANDDRLILHTDDGKYVYVFDMVDNTLVFDAQASSEMLWYSDLYDGAVLGGFR